MAEERKKCPCNCHLNPALKRCKLEEKRLFERFTNFTLPGYHYLGPGGNSSNGPPTNIVDAIAKEHDLAYDQAVEDFKKTHKEEESVKEIIQADEKFLQEISEIKINSTKEAIGKMIGLLGIGLKAAIERTLGYTIYPTFENIEDEEDDCSEFINKVNVFDPEPLLPSTQPPTPAPTPVPNCKLPLYPATDPAVTPSSGIRFGTTFGSRVEYDPPRFRNKFDFSINIKTVSTEGIILYVHDQKHIDFVALYLKDGRVHFSFNCGSGAASLESYKPVNDGEWHSVRFSRVATRGELVVDREPPVSGDSKGNTKTINVDPPLYLGGIDPKISDNTKLNLKGLNNTFEGCLKDFSLNNKSVKTQARAVGVIPCSDSVEAGSFFSADGGYIKYSDKFRVGVEIDIKLDIKPRDLSGLLVSVHAKKDYLLLQMVDGTVRFSVDNGKGEIWTAYTPPSPHYFCDGQWHSIQAVKSKNVVSLSVDKFFVEPGIGQSSGTDTKNPLFIGGHPPTPRPLRGLLTNKQFTGCIRNLEINAKQVALNRLPTFGNVTQSICPTI